MLPQDRVEALRAQHRTLEEAIDQESHRPLPNPERVVTLKRQKLRIKDELAGIDHPH